MNTLVSAYDRRIVGEDHASYKSGDSRPCLKPAPLPIAAATALEMIGRTPGTVIRRWQLSSCPASGFDLGRHGRNALVQATPVLRQVGNEANHSWESRPVCEPRISGSGCWQVEGTTFSR
jgi:hypothetical protein